MKNSRQFVQLKFLLIASIAILSSCKKDKTTTTTSIINATLPAPISNIVSQSMIDSLKAAGADIHEGTTPPILNGIFLMHPDSCIYDNSPGHFTGQLFDDYKFRFSGQNNSLYTITVEQKNVVSGILNSTPVKSYISGSGNDFSVFLLRTITPSGIVVQQFNVLSGTIVATGIQNFKNTLYIRSKQGDPTNIIAPAGTVRVFVTGAPGIATTSGSF